MPPNVVFSVDQSKSMRDQAAPGHNRWHPDIPPVASVKPGSVFRVECREWTDAQIKNSDSANDVRDADLSVAHMLSGPIEVEGAQPGDLLVVEILDLGPCLPPQDAGDAPGQGWGYTGIFARENGGGFLTDYFPQAHKAIWEFEFGPPLVDEIQPRSYCALQRSSDAGYPPGRQHYWKSAWLTDLSDGAIEVMLGFLADKPSPATGIALQQLHGAAARVDPAATAFPHRGGNRYDFLILSQWSDPADSERNVRWTRTFFEAMQPFLEPGVYVNDLGEEGEDRVRAAYGANYDRLAALKAAYDPANLFRVNQNIQPAARQ